MTQRHFSLEEGSNTTGRAGRTSRDQEKLRLSKLMGDSVKDVFNEEGFLAAKLASNKGYSKSDFVERSTKNPSIMEPTSSEAFRNAFILNSKMKLTKSKLKDSFRSTRVGLEVIQQKKETSEAQVNRYQQSEKPKVKDLKEKKGSLPQKIIRQPSIADMIPQERSFADSPRNQTKGNYSSKSPSTRNLNYGTMRTARSFNFEASIPRLASIVDTAQFTRNEMSLAPQPSVNLDKTRRVINDKFRRFLLTYKNEVQLSKNTELAIKPDEIKIMHDFVVSAEKLMIDSDNWKKFDWQQFVEAYKGDQEIGQMWSYLNQSIGELQDNEKKKTDLYQRRLVDSIKKRYDDSKATSIIQKFLVEGNTNQAIARVMSENANIISGQTLQPYLKTNGDRFVVKKRSRQAGRSHTGHTNITNLGGGAGNQIVDGSHMPNSKIQRSRSRVIGNPNIIETRERDEEICLAKLSRNPELNKVLERSKNVQKNEEIESSRLGGIFKVIVNAKSTWHHNDIAEKTDPMSQAFNQLKINKTPYLKAKAFQFQNSSSEAVVKPIKAFGEGKYQKKLPPSTEEPFSPEKKCNLQPHLPFSFSIGQEPLSFGITHIDYKSKQVNSDLSQSDLATREMGGSRTNIEHENRAGEKGESRRVNQLGAKMVAMLRKIDMYRLTLQEVIENRLFPSIEDPPHPNIKEFILAVKNNDRPKVVSHLQADRYIVYYFDAVSRVDIRQA